MRMIYHFAVPILFGTYNTSTATTEEAELSKSLQTAFANFVKNPGNISDSPAPNWPAYEPGLFEIARIPTLAKIAYEENVALDDFVDPVQPISTVSTRDDHAKFTCLLLNIVLITKQDKPCIVWDGLLDPRTLTSAENSITSMVDKVDVQDSTSSPLLRVQVSE